MGSSPSKGNAASQPTARQGRRLGAMQARPVSFESSVGHDENT